MNTVTIATVARKIDMSPKVARQKVRRAGKAAPQHLRGKPYEYAANKVRSVEKFLRG